MQNDIINRSAEDEIAFGTKTIQFADDLYEVCHRIKKNLIVAADNIQDESGASALRCIDDTMNNILAILSGEDGPRTLGARCLRQGQALREIEESSFGRGR